MAPLSLLRRLAACACMALGMANAHAAYPDRPVKLVVPYSPGGPADLLGRYVANQLSIAMGQTFIVENRPGAGLVVGADYVAKSPADGYTLFVAASSMLTDPGARDRKPSDTLRDFAPVSLIGSLPLVVAVNPALPIRDVRELIAYVKAHPDDTNFGSSGNGSLTQLAGDLFNQSAGVTMQHVPYRGINEAMADLMAGRVQLAFAGAPIALPLAQTGKVRAIAVTSAERTSSAPNLPTMSESGLRGFDVTPWYGIMAPVATPQPVVDRLQAEIVRIMKTDEVKERWKAWGADPTYSRTPAEFAALVRSEMAKWARLQKKAE